MTKLPSNPTSLSPIDWIQVGAMLAMKYSWQNQPIQIVHVDTPTVYRYDPGHPLGHYGQLIYPDNIISIYMERVKFETAPGGRIIVLCVGQYVPDRIVFIHIPAETQ